MNKKEKTTGIITFLIVLLSASPCNNDDSENHMLIDSADVYAKNFITKYVVPNEVEVGIDNSICYFRFNGKEISQGMKAYDTLSKTYNDTAYNSTRPIEGISALSTNLDSLTIYSDSDFNEAYKAGENLNKLVTVEIKSFGPYVLSNYSSEYHYLIHNNTVKKKYLDLTKEDRTLMAPGQTSIIYFTTLPTLSQVHNMTFTFYFANGTVLSATQQMDFSKIKRP